MSILVEVEKKRFEELLEIEDMMKALIEGGVKNWEDYEYSLQEFYAIRRYEADVSDLVRQIIKKIKASELDEKDDLGLHIQNLLLANGIRFDFGEG